MSRGPGATGEGLMLRSRGAEGHHHSPWRYLRMTRVIASSAQEFPTMLGIELGALNCKTCMHFSSLSSVTGPRLMPSFLNDFCLGGFCLTCHLFISFFFVSL